MEESNSNNKKKELLDRLRKSAPAAVAGAFASFAGAAVGDWERRRPGGIELGIPILPESPVAVGTPALTVALPWEYARSLTLDASKFGRSLSGVSAGPGDRIFVLSDGAVKIFSPEGSPVRSWKAPEKALCIAVSRDERVYLGFAGRVEAFDTEGRREGGFQVGDAGKQASVTAIKFLGKEILVGDASAKCIRRCDENGKQLGQIGFSNKVRGFMLPNGFLDLDVAPNGMVVTADPGRHRVSLWKADGTPAGQFGKFGLANPGDFVGCCNPVNLAVAPDGKIVVAEKVAARVKVFDAAGKLLAVIGPENFDPKFTHLHLAVDSRGRILAADPVRLELKGFEPSRKPGGREDL